MIKPKESKKLKKSEVLKRGWNKKCPHCGESNIFATWFTINEKCENCDFIFEQNHGDSWAFWIIGDRFFLGAFMIALFWVIEPESFTSGLTLFSIIMIPLIVTMPNRMGVCIALDYFSREYLGDEKTVNKIKKA